MSPNEKDIFIPGPAGQIEAVLTIADNARQTIGIVCHPHPLHGGTMQNKVVTTVVRAFRDLAITSIRFNFRGVNKSAGTFSDGSGETEDALAVIQWATEAYPHYDLWLAGFSFGAYVALNAAYQYKNVQQLITIAPAVEHANFAGLQVDCPWIVVIAGQDTVVSVDAIEKWLLQLQPSPEVLRFPKANHFFDGELVNLRQQLIEKLKYAHTI